MTDTPTIAQAVKTEAVTSDKLFQAARLVADAKCLDQSTKDGIIEHISNARAKHPQLDAAAEDKYETPTPMAKFAAKVAVASKAKS